MDAVHIRWVQAAGPDEEANGLDLCVLHPKLFDRGAFSLAKDGRGLAPEQAHGTGGFEESLLRHHGKEARRTRRPAWQPHGDCLDWHGREVFRRQPGA